MFKDRGPRHGCLQYLPPPEYNSRRTIKYGSHLVPVEMPGHIAFERLKIILCRKERVRESVPKMYDLLFERKIGNSVLGVG